MKYELKSHLVSTKVVADDTTKFEGFLESVIKVITGLDIPVSEYNPGQFMMWPRGYEDLDALKELVKEGKFKCTRALLQMFEDDDFEGCVPVGVAVYKSHGREYLG